MWHILLLACAVDGPSAGGADTPPVEDTEPIGGGDDSGFVINEVMSDNAAAYGGDDGTFPDWVELHNATDEAIALSRVTLRDESGEVWQGGRGEIAPDVYMLVLADEGAGELHAPFRIAADGETLTLGIDGETVDSVVVPALEEDIAWARFPDGGAWDETALPTPGATNGSAAVHVPGSLDELYAADVVRRIDISLSADAYALLASGDSSTIDGYVYDYVEGEFCLDGACYDPVGVRLRGVASYQNISGKAGFKIDMNRHEDFRYQGQEAFNTLNMYWDASLVREYVAYHIFRSFGVPAARNAYAQVYVNGDYVGVELLSEVYDDEFLRNWYGDGEGYMLWEEGFDDCEEGPCDSAVADAFLTAVNQPPSEAALVDLEQVLDMDEALREIAGELALGQWDGYCAPHNFRYAYNPTTGLLQIVPSSLDLLFDNLVVYPMDLYSCPGSGVLAFCLEVESCAEHYDTILLDLADRVEGDMEVQALMDTIEPNLGPLAEAETRSQYTEAQWAQQFQYVRDFLTRLPDAIRAEVATGP